MKYLSVIAGLAVLCGMLPAEEIVLSESFSFTEHKAANASRVFIRYPFFELSSIFLPSITFADDADVSTNAKSEIAAKITYGDVSLLAGNLVKSTALSRLNNPLSSAYTAPLGQPVLPVSGTGSGIPRTEGTHPTAAALQFRFLDVYANDEDSAGLSVRVPVRIGGGTTGSVTGAAYTYRLARKTPTTWFVDTPLFAPGYYTSFLGEASFRSRIRGQQKTAQKMPYSSTLITGYGAAGFAESPEGGFVPWFRLESSVSDGFYALKGRLFYAPDDFYTPESRLIAQRVRFSVNPLVHFPLSAQHTLIDTCGVSVSGDSSTHLYSFRLANCLSDGGKRAVTVLTGLDNLLAADDGTLNAASGTVLPLQLTAKTRFPLLDATMNAAWRWYPGANWDSKKTQYSAALTLNPLHSANAPHSAIPDATLKTEWNINKDGSVKGDCGASARWKLRQKPLTFSAAIEMTVPCYRRAKD
jgi:hypothetical protein